MRTSKVTEKVREYIMTRPFVRECLEEGIVNYSALARHLMSELRKLNIEATEGSIKMALIRIRNEVLRFKEELEERIRGVIASSIVGLHTDLAVVNVCRKALPKCVISLIKLGEHARFFHLIQGEASATIVVPRELLRRVIDLIGEDNVIRVLNDQTAIVIVSPENVMRTPGVMAYITSALASHGINVTHIASSYRETIIVCGREEAARAYSVLEDLISTARKPMWATT